MKKCTSAPKGTSSPKQTSPQQYESAGKPQVKGGGK